MNKIKYKIVVEGSTYVNIDSSSGPRLAKTKLQINTQSPGPQNLLSTACHIAIVVVFSNG